MPSELHRKVINNNSTNPEQVPLRSRYKHRQLLDRPQTQYPQYAKWQPKWQVFRQSLYDCHPVTS